MKRFLSLALAAAMVLSLTACGGNTESTGSASTDGSSSVTAPADDSSAGTSDTSDTSDQVIEEIPYELGGELTPTMIANSVLNKGDQTRLAKVIKKLQAGEGITVAYLGGSITQGSSAGNELCYAALTTKWLSEQFPDAIINYVNAGIGATGSYIGVHRCDEEVLSHDPDLVFIDFSVNDTSDRIATNKSTYESLIRKIWKHDTAPAIITIAMTQENGTSVQTAHHEIAEKYGIPMISYRNAILDVIDKGYIVWDDISDDDIHPNVPGHAVLTQMITNYIQTVIDNADSIDTSSDPALPEPNESGDKFENARLLRAGDPSCISTGVFKEMEGTSFGNFANPWRARIKADDIIDIETSSLVFELEAKNIGILYGKLTGTAGKVNVYVDDELIKVINGDFSGGWGNYVEFAEITSFPETGKHTLKIVPVDEDDTCQFYVSAIAVS